MLRKAWTFAIVAGVLLGFALAVPADAPRLKVVIGVTGLDKKEQQAALEAALKPDKRYAAVKAEAKQLTLDVNPGSTIELSTIENAIKAVSTDAAPVALDKAGTRLASHCTIKLNGADGAAEAAAVKTLQGVEGVGKVEGKGGAFEVDFKSGKGASLADFDAALQKSLPAIDGAVPVSVTDVLWTAPAPEPSKKKEHPHKKGG